jgi:hypothetical protein
VADEEQVEVEVEVEIGVGVHRVVKDQETSAPTDVEIDHAPDHENEEEMKDLVSEEETEEETEDAVEEKDKDVLRVCLCVIYLQARLLIQFVPLFPAVKEISKTFTFLWISARNNREALHSSSK